jgi:hypothetical protein
MSAEKNGKEEELEMLLRIGNNRAKVKPAMITLVAAIIIGIVSVVSLRRNPVQAAPDFGYANPLTWRFEARPGSEATAVSGAVQSAGSTAATLDAATGVTVRVLKTGPSIDSVYLRNAFNLDLNQERRPLRLTFEARAGDGNEGSEPFPMTFTVRDTSTLLWSERILAEPTWKSYERKISLKKSALLNVIMAIHLGEKTGAMQIRNLRVVEDKTENNG